MGDTTIQWTDKVWNVVTGCEKVSPGCKHCYAERVFPRAYSHNTVTEWSGDDNPIVRQRKFTDVLTHADRLKQPFRWVKPKRVFVNSMSDLFHQDVPDEFIDKVFAVMALTPKHAYQILTKRPERMLEYVSKFGPTIEARFIEKIGLIPWPLSNVWLGVSVENQEWADERVQQLMKTPAAVRFISYEPALQAVDFTRVRVGPKDSSYRANALTGDGFDGKALDWVIVGGESGPGARPFNIQWARDVISQCKAAGVACFVKQLGTSPTGKLGGFLKYRKGGDMSEWDEDLRVREFPEVFA